jgi:hypothetical protein
MRTNALWYLYALIVGVSMLHGHVLDVLHIKLIHNLPSMQGSFMDVLV